MKIKKKGKIYIIRNNETIPTDIMKLKINNLQKKYTDMGFKVVNPLDIYSKYSFGNHKAVLYNLKELLSSSIVFVMHDVSLKKGGNTELRISLDLSLTVIIQDCLIIE